MIEKQAKLGMLQYNRYVFLAEAHALLCHPLTAVYNIRDEISREATMPIVSENEPQTKRSSGIGCGWILPLLILGPTIARFVRQSTAGWLTDQQLLIIVGGLTVLIVFGIMIRRASHAARGDTTLPQPVMPKAPSSASLQQLHKQSSSSLPPSPRFEPIITGKVLLAGVLFGGLLVAAGAALILLS